jgi:hypothetical protein
MEKNLTSKIRGGIAVAAPGMSCGQKLLLGAAGVCRLGWLFSRKVRLLSKKENLVPYALGSALDVMTKSNPTLQQVARIPFGSISILRCVSDLAEISRLFRLAGRLLAGKEYVVVKKDDFATPFNRNVSPSFQDKMRWRSVVFKLQIKLFFQVIGEIFKRFFQLVLHLGDVYTAFKENTLPEVFIHSRDLWKELTSRDSKIVKYLKRSEKINDWMLEKMGAPKKTAFLVKLFLIPAKIVAKLPDGRDIKAAFQKFGKEQYSYFEANAEDQLVRNYVALGGDETEIEGRKYWIFKRGSADDPRVNRFINPPRINLDLFKANAKAKTKKV